MVELDRCVWLTGIGWMIDRDRCVWLSWIGVYD